MAKKKTEPPKIEQYEHKDKKRVNNPPVGLVTAHSDNGGFRQKTYAYDPHIDPQLQWAGKAEHTSFDVPTVSLHVHERIDPCRIIEELRKEPEASQKQGFLFEDDKKPLRQAVEFYKHAENWSNRFVAGDSLLVMNSLLEKEAMGGKVQMVYFDPPYGIKYGSNFQPFVNKRDVKDGKDEDLTAEPEMIKAFRDTWELGIHSYLTYIRDRLLLARELLADSGSVFVQISDENVHHIREICDEVFDAENFVGQISFRKKTMPLGANLVEQMHDYIIFYAKNRESIKFKHLYQEYQPYGSQDWKWVELPDGVRREMTKDEIDNFSLLPSGSRLYRLKHPSPLGENEKNKYVFRYQGVDYTPPQNGWGMEEEKLRRLEKAKRIQVKGNLPNYILFLDDFPVTKVTIPWNDTVGPQGKSYVVQTAALPIQRCLLMTTDPGDLVLDITCGSGTTAFVAENWGRRWITCDTSRVALTLAKQRLMTAKYDYFELVSSSEFSVSSEEGKVSSEEITKNQKLKTNNSQETNNSPIQFRYKTVPHVTLKSIANNEPAPEETLYDQPYTDNKRVRITGPFTVEAVPAPTAVVSNEGEVFSSEFSVSSGEETANNQKLKTNNSHADWLAALKRDGVRGKNKQRIEFVRLETLPNGKDLNGIGETADGKQVLVCFGPEHNPLEKRQVERAWKEARLYSADILLFCAFAFDEEAAKDISEMPESIGMTFLKVQMNTDLQVHDLKKKTSGNESFWLIGSPDVRVFSSEFLVSSEGSVFSSEFSVSSEEKNYKKPKTNNSEETTKNQKRMTNNYLCNYYLCNYGKFKIVSGLNCLEEINQIDKEDILLYATISERGDVWDYITNEKSGGVDSQQYRRRTGTRNEQGISPIPEHIKRFFVRIGDAIIHLTRSGLSCRGGIEQFVKRLRGDKQIAQWLNEFSKVIFSSEFLVSSEEETTKNQKLKTKNFSTEIYYQVEIMGYDYFDPKTGKVDSGNVNKIAMWMLDTDYDGRSLYPSQVFFPMSGDTDGWAKLAKNLKAELDEDKLEAFKGTVSLPFQKGRNIAVKIIDDRGIESLKVFKGGEIGNET
jgi:adenine-specific DNA-methyltransferase